MKIYFAGSIRGGRYDKDLYEEIIMLVSQYGTVLTYHVGRKDITAQGETGYDDKYIYKRDMSWLAEADFVIAEVTTPSLGVGYEIAKAENMGKRILCIHRPMKERKLSVMINGNDYIEKEIYTSTKDLKKIFEDFFHIV